MNKKQLIIAWVITAILCFILLFSPKAHVWTYGLDHKEVSNKPKIQKGTGKILSISQVRWDAILQRSIAVLIIGGLLIYTLRNKKK